MLCITEYSQSYQSLTWLLIFLIIDANTSCWHYTHQGFWIFGVCIASVVQSGISYLSSAALDPAQPQDDGPQGQICIRYFSLRLTPLTIKISFLKSCYFLVHISKYFPLPIRFKLSLNLFCYLTYPQSQVQYTSPILCLVDNWDVSNTKLFS